MYKPNPFTEYTINLGPLYVERLFDSILLKAGVKDIKGDSVTGRMEGYLSILEQRAQKGGARERLFIHFYTAHFSQQAAQHSGDTETLRNYRKQALLHYQAYLKLTNGTDESRYYSQWQMGRIQHSLSYPWPIVKESLLSANVVDPFRGESIQDIIHHYISFEDWRSAYTYSQFAVSRFFNKNPIAKRRWHVSPGCYNGKVLDTHITICKNLGYWQEAERAYRQLLNYVVEHIHEFKIIEKRLLEIVEQVYLGNKEDKMHEKQ